MAIAQRAHVLQHVSFIKHGVFQLELTEQAAIVGVPNGQVISESEKNKPYTVHIKSTMNAYSTNLETRIINLITPLKAEAPNEQSVRNTHALSAWINAHQGLILPHVVLIRQAFQSFSVIRRTSHTARGPASSMDRSQTLHWSLLLRIITFKHFSSDLSIPHGHT